MLARFFLVNVHGYNMMKRGKLCLLLASLLVSTLATAGEQQLRLQQVVDNVYAIVGTLNNRTPENLGNNATFGFVVTDAGVVLIDPGGSYKGARAIHNLIKTVTSRPVRYVINTGGQDHRWFGNDYFSQQGATIIASEAAVADQKKRLGMQWTMLETLIGKSVIAGTKEKYADITFKQDYLLNIGGTRFELYHKGRAHTPGDTYVWLPEKKVMFTGDIVYTERMLGVTEESSSKSWLAVYKAMASHKPEYLVPGHGSPTTLAKADADTLAYLEFLRREVAAFMDAGGDASEISKIDQEQFRYLENYDLLAGRNALRVFTELEWE
jgi:glyoxylase-like metal-dependent hydrolase (beta-lactamase superfamily II)